MASAENSMLVLLLLSDKQLQPLDKLTYRKGQKSPNSTWKKAAIFRNKNSTLMFESHLCFALFSFIILSVSRK